MSKRVEIVSSFYDSIEEDLRLGGSWQGQLEYFTTMNYIRRFAKGGDKILEIGAGTGRYSISLAEAGFDVTAVELVESNLEVLKKNSSGLKNIQSFQGDALNLGGFEDDTFDVTLVFGPMYHLYEEKDVHRALEETVRVTKSGGVILIAFLSVYAILFDNYLQGNLADGIEENFTENYEVKHFEEQLFTGYDIAEFEQLMESVGVKHITTAAMDSVLELAAGRGDFAMSEEEFEMFAKYHLATCEKRELLGCSSHLLYVCRKE